MEEQPLHTLGIAQASARIHAGELSPVDLVEACLQRIEALNPALNAFLTVMTDQARQQAEYAAEAIQNKQSWGVLHGIPIGLKDLIHVAGVVTTAGSLFMRDHVAHGDALVVQQLRAAGAVIIGKTHLHEFAIGATNVNPHYGPARNPWNIHLSPGGSSGGSGAAVAAGMCPGALGTDTGGSVRVPSALCGLTGLRPAISATSTRGVVPMSWTLDTIGPMARNARDAAILYETLAADPEPDFVNTLDDPVGRLRIGLPVDDYFWQETTIEVVSAVRGAVDMLTETDHAQVPVSLPTVEDATRAGGIISLGDAAAFHRKRLESQPGQFGDDVRKRLEWGLARSAADYADARQTARAWRHAVHTLFRDEIDVLALPTLPLVNHPIEGSEGLRAARELLRFTYPISLTDLPALSLPCGFTADGLPIGLQLVGRKAETILHLAHHYQQITDWHTRRPPDPETNLAS